jgi:hypothetical protein
MEEKRKVRRRSMVVRGASEVGKEKEAEAIWGMLGSIMDEEVVDWVMAGAVFRRADARNREGRRNLEITFDEERKREVVLGMKAKLRGTPFGEIHLERWKSREELFREYQGRVGRRILRRDLRPPARYHRNLFLGGTGWKGYG